MSLAAHAHRERARRLMNRLDTCVERIDRQSPVREHAVVYAAFLTDFAAGRMNVDDPKTMTLIGMANEFCDLVEREFPVLN